MKRFAWNICLTCLLGAFSGCGDDGPRRRGEINVRVENAGAGVVELVRGTVVVGRQDFDLAYTADLWFNGGGKGLEPGKYELRGTAENGKKAARTLQYSGGYQTTTLYFQ